MKVYIQTDELYPVYVLETGKFVKGQGITIKKEIYDRYLQAGSLFRKSQDEIEKIYNK